MLPQVKIDFTAGVPIWFTLGVIAWIGVAAAGISVRLDREGIMATQKRLGEQMRSEQRRNQEEFQEAIRRQQHEQRERAEQQRRQEEQIEKMRRAEQERRQQEYERRVSQIAEGIRSGRCGGNPRGAYWCCDPGMWAHPGGGCSRSPPRR
jgi:hypothetical protein